MWFDVKFPDRVKLNHQKDADPTYLPVVFWPF